jgi:hypothetical protein
MIINMSRRTDGSQGPAHPSDLLIILDLPGWLEGEILMTIICRQAPH